MKVIATYNLTIVQHEKEHIDIIVKMKVIATYNLTMYSMIKNISIS